MTSLTTYALIYVVFPAENQHGSSPFVLEMHADMLNDMDNRTERGESSSPVNSEKHVGVMQG